MVDTSASDAPKLEDHFVSFAFNPLRNRQGNSYHVISRGQIDLALPNSVVFISSPPRQLPHPEILCILEFVH